MVALVSICTCGKVSVLFGSKEVGGNARVRCGINAWPDNGMDTLLAWRIWHAIGDGWVDRIFHNVTHINDEVRLFDCSVVQGFKGIGDCDGYII